MTTTHGSLARRALRAGALTVGLGGLSLGGAVAAHAAPIPALHTTARAVRTAAPQWATYDARTKTASLTVISAYGADTYNFNGGIRGRFTFTVPLGSKVVVTYTNQSMHMPHGVEIVPFTTQLPTMVPPPAPAFPGAASPNYLHGTPSGVTQHFSFVADKAGTYRMICPVHNHVKFGHWDWFVVSATARTATGALAA